MKVVTASSMRELERRADTFGLTSAALMQLAGLAVADEVAESLGGARGRRVLILVGPGNNGGDGLVCGCRLHDRGARVTLYIWNRKLEGDGNYALCLKRGIEPIQADDDVNFEKLKALLLSADAAIDALLGIGISRPITGTLEGILRTLDDVRRQRPLFPRDRLRPFFVALDVPTGLNSDTGEMDPACFAADLTVTLGFPKVGLFLFPGAGKAGKLTIRDIGIPAELAEDIPTRLLNDQYVGQLLPPRPADAHKGTFGKVLVVGGSTNYIGAPALASISALRTGAGLVTQAAPRSLNSVFASKLTEVTFLPLPEAEEGVLGMAAVKPVLEALAEYDVLLIGPGLGRHPETFDFVREVLKSCPSTSKVVVDADALNALVQSERWWEKTRSEMVLTPHAGEMSRLVGRSIPEVNADRLEVARRCSAEWGKTVVLKGPFTLIAGLDGYINIAPAANPALASAGTGDVLSGIIAGMLAQGLNGFNGASAGVYVHAESGEAVRRNTGSAGLLASDLLDHIPRALKAIREA